MSLSASILLIAPSAYPLGGVATWLDYLVPGLQCHWNVTVALTSGTFHDVDAYRKVHPLDVISVPCGNGTRESRVTNLAKTIASVDPDIVAFVNIPDSALAADRLKASASWFGKCVMIVHGLEPEPIVDCMQLAQSLDAVICTNRLACELTNQIGGVPEDRIYYAPYGIKVPPNLPWAANAIGSKKIKLGYVGRFEQHQKRVLDLTALGDELLRRDIPFAISIAGGGPDEELVKASLLTLPNDCVSFLGQIPQNQISGLVYSEIDILMIPSLWETGPIVAWEAMACGVPVLSAQFVGSGREGRLRHKENCMLFPIGNMQAAADCVEELLDWDTRSAVAQNAHRYVTNNCTEDHSVSAFHAAFSQILPNTSIPGGNPALTRLLAQKAGRLDAIFGPRTGDRIRSLLRLSTPHTSAGGEWPHTFTSPHKVPARYWHFAAGHDGVYLPATVV